MLADILLLSLNIRTNFHTALNCSKSSEMFTKFSSYFGWSIFRPACTKFCTSSVHGMEAYFITSRIASHFNWNQPIRTESRLVYGRGVIWLVFYIVLKNISHGCLQYFFASADGWEDVEVRQALHWHFLKRHLWMITCFIMITY